MTPEQIWNEAKAAAQAAAVAMNVALPLDCCGFAWVVFDPANQPIARYLKRLGIADKHWHRGYSVFAERNLHSVETQNISVHEAAAEAAAAVFQKYGAKCRTCSRMD